MNTILVNGVEYVQKSDIKQAEDTRIQDCLEVLTEMRYFNQQHKMKGLAWNAIHALSPELATLDERAAYKRIHGNEE
jgi:hypothetical protein